MAVGGYDGMAAIFAAIKATNGKLEGDKAVAALKGWKFNSPRGPIQIDPNTRDIIMNEYLAQAKYENGRVVQKTIGKIEAVKDACKENKIGPCGK
jgi:branched-chain amino acid transport system substrate-binding protein